MSNNTSKGLKTQKIHIFEFSLELRWGVSCFLCFHRQIFWKIIGPRGLSSWFTVKRLDLVGVIILKDISSSIVLPFSLYFLSTIMWALFQYHTIPPCLLALESTSSTLKQRIWLDLSSSAGIRYFFFPARRKVTKTRV